MIAAHKRIPIVIVACLALYMLFIGGSQATVADQLWNKYRVKLIQLLQGRYPAYAKGLSAFGSETNIAKTVFHVVTDPADALWTKSMTELSEFAGYVPAWSTSWSARATTDNTLAEKYKAMLFTLPDKTAAAQAFLAYSKASKLSQESPHHERLAQFVARTANAPANAFHFIVEESSGSTSIGTLWGTRTSSFSRMSSVVRSLDKLGNKAMWDDLSLEDMENDVIHEVEEYDQMEDLFEEDEEEDMPASEFLFRRRRRSPPPPPPKPIVIKSKKFHMDMKARGLIGIPIQSICVNRRLIRQRRSQFPATWFGQNGKFALVPSVVWVAMRPHVVLRLSESEFRTVQSKWTTGFGLAIAGTLFRNKNFRQAVLNDELSDVFPHDTLDRMLENDDLLDTASFAVKSTGDDGEETVLHEGALEDFDSIMQDSAEFIVKQDSAEFIVKQDSAEFTVKNNEEMEDDEDILSMQDDTLDEDTPTSEFLFRRRRRRRAPPPPPPPPVIKEKVYEASFQSNSLFPQILAVTSDIL